MEINQSTDSKGIVQRVRWLTKADESSYPTADIIREANIALDQIFDKIVSSVGILHVDDTNYAGLSVGTFNLVAGQRTYTFTTDTENAPIIAINKVAVYESGYWRDVPFQEIHDKRTQDYLLNQSPSGNPNVSYMIGNTLVLEPAPSTGGNDLGKIWYQRGFKPFTTSDTTAMPGFARPYSHLVSLYPSYWYAVREGKDNANNFLQAIREGEEAIGAYYGDLNKDEEFQLTGAYTDPR